MDWREAFFCQARSENKIMTLLNARGVEYSHQLHYIQMVTEKLAKGFLAKAGRAEWQQTSHAAFVTMLRTIKGRPDVRTQLGYKDSQSFNRYIDSLLPLADKIEKLAPALAGTTRPNPEYPWKDRGSSDVLVPAGFAFPEFDPSDPVMVKLMNLIRQLLHIAI